MCIEWGSTRPAGPSHETKTMQRLSISTQSCFDSSITSSNDPKDEMLVKYIFQRSYPGRLLAVRIASNPRMVSMRLTLDSHHTGRTRIKTSHSYAD